MEKQGIISGCLGKLLLLFFVWGSFPATFAAINLWPQFSKDIRWVYYYDHATIHEFSIKEASLRRRYRGSRYYQVEGEVGGLFTASLSISLSRGESIFGTAGTHGRVYSPLPGRSVLPVYAIPREKLLRLPNRQGELTSRKKLMFALLPLTILVYIPVGYAWFHWLRILYRWIGRPQRH